MDGPQPRPTSLYSDLKIVPIHSHPQSLIEKFSDSSNQEVDDLDSSNASASSYLEQGPDSPPPMERPEDSEKESPVKANMPYFPHNEDSNDLSELIGKNNEKGFNILSDGEGNHPILSDNEADLQSAATRNSPYNIPQNSIPRNAKSSTSTDGVQDEVIVIDDDMSSLMPGLSREAMYSVDGQRISPSSSSVSPHASISLNSTNFPRKSPPSYFRNPEGQQVQRSNLINDMTTVDASALGISHLNQFTSVPSVSGMAQSINQNIESFPSSSNFFSRVPQSLPKTKPRYSPTFPSQIQLPNLQSSQDFQYQPQKPADIPMTNASASNNNIATFTTHMASQPTTQHSRVFQNAGQTTGAQQSRVFQNAGQTTGAQQSKVFQNPGQMMLGNSDSGKYPTMKVTLPPSTGELLVVPGDSANSGMTFHLFAQPHSNPSQPIQSRMQVFADGSVQHQNNHDSVQHQGNHSSVQHQTNHGSIQQQSNHGSVQHQSNHGAVQHQGNQAAANSVENQVIIVSLLL